MHPSKLIYQVRGASQCWQLRLNYLLFNSLMPRNTIYSKENYGEERPQWLSRIAEWKMKCRMIVVISVMRATCEYLLKMRPLTFPSETIITSHLLLSSSTLQQEIVQYLNFSFSAFFFSFRFNKVDRSLANVTCYNYFQN